MKRNDFLKTLGFGSAGLLIGESLLSSCMNHDMAKLRLDRRIAGGTFVSDRSVALPRTVLDWADRFTSRAARVPMARLHRCVRPSAVESNDRLARSTWPVADGRRSFDHRNAGRPEVPRAQSRARSMSMRCMNDQSRRTWAHSPMSPAPAIDRTE